MTPMPHPPYSPNLALNDFSFVSLLKKVFKALETFCQCEQVKPKPAEALKGIKINEFKNCFEQWKKHLDRCIASKEEYSEGD